MLGSLPALRNRLVSVPIRPCTSSRMTPMNTRIVTSACRRRRRGQVGMHTSPATSTPRIAERDSEKNAPAPIRATAVNRSTGRR